METGEFQSPLSYRRARLIWLNGGVASSSVTPQYKRVKVFARECRIPLHELNGDRLSNKDLERFFSVLEASGAKLRGCILAVAGLYLEDQVSRCCLQALAEGYDAHLLSDVVFPLEKDLLQAHLARLTQAGVVPSSLNQMASFFIAEEDDVGIIDHLKQQIKADQ